MMAYNRCEICDTKTAYSDMRGYFDKDNVWCSHCPKCYTKARKRTPPKKAKGTLYEQMDDATDKIGQLMETLENSTEHWQKIREHLEDVDND